MHLFATARSFVRAFGSATLSETRDRFGSIHLRFSTPGGDAPGDDGSQAAADALCGRLRQLCAAAPPVDGGACDLPPAAVAPCAVWLRLPLTLSAVLLPVAARHGLRWHHAEDTECTLVRWLATGPSRLPRFATHQLGAAGLVLDEQRREILCVQDRHSHNGTWKLPGGLAELGEDLAAAAQREVWEETGVRTDFRGILAFRQQHRQSGAFGRSDLYMVTRLAPLSRALQPCTYEISACAWLPIAQLLLPSSSDFTRRLARLALHGLEHGFANVEMVPETMPSIRGDGRTFELFHHQPLQLTSDVD